MSRPFALVFDAETTGVDTKNDRIVQWFMATVDDEGTILDKWEWFIDPGIDIPKGASDVHGFTTEKIQEIGSDPKEALTEIMGVFRLHLNIPWIAYNANFDLSIIDSELKRHGVSDRFGTYAEKNVQIYDAIVIDRAKDKYRKGRRTLEALAKHYGVEFNPEEAHDASYDVEKTAQVTVKVLRRFGRPSNAEQARMYRTWAEGLEKHLRKEDPTATVDRDWPLRKD